jgi:hypothetical protein
MDYHDVVAVGVVLVLAQGDGFANVVRANDIPPMMNLRAADNVRL